ncbi:hypothetical protein HOC99_03560 [Candidatus Woesearchaeota archaeon]|nr:hypothetical protein [Candidatus Woesearchaeota archaeon]MBT4387650.1 hypothetical protein [Candidatus Woesearchaeota archaeon]MBT4595987.1 hypothetical protein [Candidatus Woesearchaeota archaeon]MBT5741178.1 hypothetical protein [Candidatus Woesearchaeota archaeon]MBT7296746.1 hypothetical protein [Candidatus Woesearchaeota archaeon]
MQEIQIYVVNMNLCNKKCQKNNSCIYKQCPYNLFKSINTNIINKNNYSGPLVNTFIGSFNYPNVNMSVIANYKKDFNDIDDVTEWKNKKLNINDILLRRIHAINSSKQNNVKSVKTNDQKSLRTFNINKPINKNKKYEIEKQCINNSLLVKNSFEIDKIQNKDFMQNIQLLSLSNKNIEGEINFSSRIQSKIQFDSYTKPFGPKVNLKNFSIEENVHVPTVVDKIINDDLNANEALIKLNKKNFDSYYLTKIFSTGNLGKNKRIVPTKWSITAVDDSLSIQNLKNIKQFDIGNDYMIYTDNYLGNHYIILFMPNQFSYQLNEIMIDNTMDLFDSHLKKVREINLNYNYDYENFYGRKNYATNTAGAYYAARYSISQKLMELKRQYKVAIFRFISNEYYVPLGVWVVREGILKTLQTKPIIFQDEELVKNYILQLSKKKYRVNINNIFKESKIFNEKEEQKNILLFT